MVLFNLEFLAFLLPALSLSSIAVSSWPSKSKNESNSSLLYLRDQTNLRWNRTAFLMSFITTTVTAVVLIVAMSFKAVQMDKFLLTNIILTGISIFLVGVDAINLEQGEHPSDLLWFMVAIALFFGSAGAAVTESKVLTPIPTWTFYVVAPFLSLAVSLLISFGIRKCKGRSEAHESVS